MLDGVRTSGTDRGGRRKIHVQWSWRGGGNLNRPRVDGGAFVRDPFSQLTLARGCTKQGTFGRWLADLERLSFLGRQRLFHCQRLAGATFRVELGEIEVAVGRASGVARGGGPIRS